MPNIATIEKNVRSKTVMDLINYFMKNTIRNGKEMKKTVREILSDTETAFTNEEKLAIKDALDSIMNGLKAIREGLPDYVKPEEEANDEPPQP
jgi:phosphopantothenate synthetase